MEKYQEINDYVNQVQEELIQLIKDLCAIPSFSHKEKEKAQFIHNWFKQYNIDTIIDEKYNVVLPINYNDECTIFCAHIDTVFPDETGFVCEEKNGKLYAPGVGDDTANVALLMLIARYLVLNHINIKNALIVFNSCEEGLGNLEGIRHIMNTYKNVKEFYSFDLTYEEIICKAVGSNRYRITILTEGGHSYSAFGNTNAIAICSDMIHDFYQYQVPTRGKSTYNVGVIEGGTSVNTIAQSASFLFEYRSDNHEDLKEMIKFFNQTIKKYQNKYNIQVEIIGERPSHGDDNQEKLDEIVNNVSTIIEMYSSKKPVLSSGSTDCNIPYSLGIPGCCFGGYIGKCEHTREEWIDIASLEVGMKILMHFMIDYFNKKEAIQ